MPYIRYVLLLLLCCLVASDVAAGMRDGRVGGNSPPLPVVLHNYVVGSGLTQTDQVGRYDVDGNQIDGGVSGITGAYARFGDTFYMYGWSVWCGNFWLVPHPPGAPNCGFVVYSSPDHINWKRLGTLITPTLYNCEGGAEYQCVPIGMLYDAANNRYVLWMTSSAAGPTNGTPPSHFYMVWFCTKPGGEAEGGTCTRQVDPAPTCGYAGVYFGSGMIFVDDDGAAYLKCDYERQISIQRLNTTFTNVTGSPTLCCAIDGEGGGMFRWTDGKVYVTIGPACFGCPGGSVGRLYSATAPLGPYTDTGQPVNVDFTGPKAACQAQTGPFETIQTPAGRVVLAHPAQTLGAGPSLNDYVGLVRDVGSPPYPRFPCEATTTIPGLSTTGPPAPPAGINQSSENGWFWEGIGTITSPPATDGISSLVWYLQTFKPTIANLSHLDLTVARTGAVNNPTFPDGDLVISLVNVNQTTGVPTGPLGSSVTVPAASIYWSYVHVSATFNQAVTPGTIYGIQVRGLNHGPTTSPTADGTYTVPVDRNNPYPDGKALISTNGGGTWADLGGGLWDLRFRTFQ